MCTSFLKQVTRSVEQVSVVTKPIGKQPPNRSDLLIEENALLNLKRLAYDSLSIRFDLFLISKCQAGSSKTFSARTVLKENRRIIDLKSYMKSSATGAAALASRLIDLFVVRFFLIYKSLSPCPLKCGVCQNALLIAFPSSGSRGGPLVVSLVYLQTRSKPNQINWWRSGGSLAGCRHFIKPPK